MDRVRGVFDDPVVLADDSSAGAVVAGAVRVTLPRAGAGVAPDVGGDGRADRTLAQRDALHPFDAVELDSGRHPVRHRNAAVQTFANGIQPHAVVRGSRNRGWKSGAAAGHDRDSGAGAASGVPGASVRDVGLERGDGASGVLAADGIRDGHGRGDDSDGGCGVGEAVWGGVRGVSRASAGSTTETGWMIAINEHSKIISSAK